jgi:hypothetical protein
MHARTHTSAGRPLCSLQLFFLFFCPDVPPHTRLLTAPYMYVLVNILVILVSLYIHTFILVDYVYRRPSARAPPNCASGEEKKKARGEEEKK